MSKYEYKVVAAPKKGLRQKGVKGTADRFAHTLMTLMNDLGREGWEYLRADTLPVDERSGLTGTSTTFQNMLIFRRDLDESATDSPVADSPAKVQVIGNQIAEQHEAAAHISLAQPAHPAPNSGVRLTAVPDHDSQAPDLGPAISNTTP